MSVPFNIAPLTGCILSKLSPREISADFGLQNDRVYVPGPMSWCWARRKFGAQDNTYKGKEWKCKQTDRIAESSKPMIGG
jgi:hypothetical protein